MTAAAVPLQVRRRANASDLPLPRYQSDGASGLDVVAAIDEPMCIEPGRHALVPTGLEIAVPRGFEVQVRARSGLAVRHGLFVLNGPGTIDSDYRGEVAVIIANFGAEPFTITRGMRIAQLVVAPVVFADVQVVDLLPVTLRGDGGFGSTGSV